MQTTVYLKTMFAPAERATEQELSAQIALVKNTPSLTRILDSVLDMVLLLNRHRQVVFCNVAVAEAFALHDRDAICGMRPGEAMGCRNSARQVGGCGTDEHCSVCGAVNAIMVAIGGEEQVSDCHVLRTSGEALDLLVKTTPFRLGSEGLIMVAMRDVSAQNRHHIMERVFCHDILNTACSIKLLSQYKTWSRRANRILNSVDKGITRLINEVHFQQDLTAAESGRLAVRVAPVKAAELVCELVDAWEPLAKSQHCSIEASGIQDVSLNTDRRLLSRVIGNMLKNAIEASAAGDEVTIVCGISDESVSFTVSNRAVISKANQLQMFQRSFSTKGHGRGIGTYSMKLLSEKYLGGKITLVSQEPKGTTFTVTLPLSGPA